jgi:hypothetical protein
MIQNSLIVIVAVQLITELFFSPAVSGQVDPFPSKPRPSIREHPARLLTSSYEAAKKGWEDVVRLRSGNKDDEAFARDLGFDSAEQAQQAQLGGSLSIYISNLAWFKDAFGSDFTKLVKVTGRRMFTLHFNGQPKSSVTVAFDPGTQKWHPVEWGSRKLIRRFEKQRTLHPGITFVLSISPENPWRLWFVGEERAGMFFLIPLANIDAIDLREGQEVDAITFVNKIKTLAAQLPKQ